MRSDAFITVTCDRCREAVDIQLTTTARGYDERDVDKELRSLGWDVNNGEDVCDECQRTKGDE